MQIKIVFTVVALLLFSQTFSAQIPPELEISDLKYVYDINRNLQIRTAGTSSGQLSPFNAPTVQEISAVFHNKGDKTIKKIYWEFVFYKKSDAKKIKRIYKVKSHKDIAPNESVKLSKQGRIILNTGNHGVNVFLIEYADGTVWKGKKLKE